MIEVISILVLVGKWLGVYAFVSFVVGTFVDLTYEKDEYELTLFGRFVLLPYGFMLRVDDALEVSMVFRPFLREKD